MTSSTASRIARIAALALCPVAAVATTTPSWADDPADGARTTARAGTGALVSKSLSARTTLTSTSGKSLTLSVSATGTSTRSTVMIGVGQGKETHLWTFKARAADLKVGSTGAGTLTLSSTQTGDRGRLNLKFSPTDTMRKRTCGGQVASKSRKVAVSGIAYFKTATSAWGSVGRSSRAITLRGANSVGWTYDVTCPTPTPACSRNLSWNSYASTGSTWTSVSGSSNGTSATVSGFRSVSLTKPTGASRLDMVTRTAPLPSFSQSGASATLRAKSGTSILDVAGDGAFDNSSPCRSGSTTTTQVSTQWFGTATNGSPAFRVPAQVFGAFGVPNGSSASINRLSVHNP